MRVSHRAADRLNDSCDRHSAQTLRYADDISIDSFLLSKITLSLADI